MPTKPCVEDKGLEQDEAFLWQAISNCVATAERLMYRHIDTERSCPICAGPVESINHLFLNALQPFKFGLYRTICPFRVTSRVYPHIKTWTSYFGREKRWLLWDHNSIPSHGSVGTFGRWGTTNSLMGKMYPQSIFFSTRLLRQNVGEKLMRRRKQMRIMTVPLLQRLRQCPLRCPESLPVKLMHHGSIMAASVA